MSATFATTALLAGTVLLGQGTANATNAGGQDQCGTQAFYTVEKVGAPTYKPIAPTAGKYNSSKSTAKLRYEMSTTISRQTAWTFSGGMTVKAGIVQIEAKTSYEVTNKTSKGRKVTNVMNVRAKRYGFTTPKVKYQKFNIRKERYGPQCRTVVIKDYGLLNAIVAYPFFSECQTKSSSGCTPKP
ncbi:hypothetical protein ACFZC6_19230 [Streptomyces ossamyceticus]|uniref:hypothetical protein n=1 Tax=Streptomyces ossamyceticus TaxID=249581 RepID=UPI0036E6B109